MLPSNSMSIGYEYVGEPIIKFPPINAAELDGVGLGGDILGEGFGLGAVEEADLLRLLHRRIGSH